MGKRSVWIKIAAAIASGLLVAGLFPPFRMSFMVWVAFVPLLVALWSIEGKRAGWKGFALGWLAGTASCLVQFNWLSVVSSLGAVLLPLYLGIYWGLFGAFAASIGNPWKRSAAPLSIAFSHAAMWAGIELLRGWVITGFGWNALGVAFQDAPVFAQAADLLGLTGLAMLPVFFQAVAVQAGRRWIQGDRRLPLDVITALVVVMLSAGYGLARLALEKRGEKIRLKTLLVQINIPQDAAVQTWDALQVHMAYEEETTKALEAIKAKNPADWPDWVMWPECALTGRIFVTDDGTWGTGPENLKTIATVRETGPFQLIYGVNELEAEKTADGQLAMKEDCRAWNSLAVMTPDDQLKTYRKRHLVIFGETIPFVDSIPWLKQIYEQQSGAKYGGSFTPGVSLDPLPIATARGEVIGAIPTVCFEDSVPRLTRKFVREGPQVIVNVTNDGWFKESAAADQHFAYARFRAIELRRPMLRCANTGVSTAIDSTGSTAHPDTGKAQVLVDGNGSHFTRGSLLVDLDVPLHPPTTLYAVIGDYGVIALSLSGFALAWTGRRRTSM